MNKKHYWRIFIQSLVISYFISKIIAKCLKVGLLQELLITFFTCLIFNIAIELFLSIYKFIKNKYGN